MVDEYVTEDTLKEFSRKIDITLQDVIKKYDINFQIQEVNAALKSEWDTIDGN